MDLVSIQNLFWMVLWLGCVMKGKVLSGDKMDVSSLFFVGMSITCGEEGQTM